MDPLSIAAAATQFIGMAAQMVDGIARFRRRIINVKNAPKVIRSLNHELLTIQAVAEYIASVEQNVPEEARPKLVEAMHDCWKNIEDIVILLGEIKIQKGDRRVKQMWDAVVADGKRPELEDGLRKVGRSRSTLNQLLAGINVKLTSEGLNQLKRHTGIVEASHQRIETGVEVISRRTEDIYVQTLEVRGDIAQSSLEIMASIERIADDIPGLIDRTLQNRLNEFIREIGHALPVSPRGSAQSQVCTSGSFNPLRDSMTPIPGNNVQSHCDADILRHCALSTQKRVHRRLITKKFPIPIGFVQTKAVRSGIGETDQFTYIEISIIPFRWLSSTGRIVSMSKASTYNHISGPSWNVSLRSYNIISADSMIFRACRNRDLQAIQKLFDYGQASPFDVDSHGRTLLSYVWNQSIVTDELYPEEATEIQQTLEFLMTQGVDPTSYVAEFLHAYQRWTDMLRFWSLSWEDEILRPDDDAVWKTFEGVLRLCLKHSQTDPFMQSESVVSLWKASLGGESVPALNPSFLFEHLTGLGGLVYDFPDQVFHDILLKRQYILSNEVYQKLMDQNYQMLVELCRGGPTSIKNKVFAKDYAQSASRLENGRTCYCPTQSSHLLFLALHGTRLSDCVGQARVNIARKHVRRMLVELLKSGENPEASCACQTSWQPLGGFCSLADLAGKEGLLSTWMGALEESGYDSTRFVDDWRYEGVQDLFIIEESALPRPQSPRETLSSPYPTSSLTVVGSFIYQTLSTIV